MSKPSGTSTDRAAIADMFRNAARVLESQKPGNGACEVLGDFCPMALDQFSEVCLCGDASGKMGLLFKPSGGRDYWMGEFTDENQGARVLMLCFMAAMVEAGDA